MVGMSRGRPVGVVMRYSCAIGVIGTLTPAIPPISVANMPPAFTTSSVPIPPARFIKGLARLTHYLARAGRPRGGPPKRAERKRDPARGADPRGEAGVDPPQP